MIHEIKATDEPIYWVARDDDGTILHSGCTDPGLTTTTGQKNFIHGTEDEQVAELEKFVARRPDADHELNTTTREWEPKLVRSTRTRT